MQIRQEDSGRPLCLVQLLETRDGLTQEYRDQLLLCLPHLEPLPTPPWQVPQLRTVDPTEEDDADLPAVVLAAEVLGQQHHDLLLAVGVVEEEPAHQREYEGRHGEGEDGQLDQLPPTPASHLTAAQNVVNVQSSEDQQENTWTVWLYILIMSQSIILSHKYGYYNINILFIDVKHTY